jgi:hypothetical protein
MEIENTYRYPNPTEKRLLERLLEANFPGRDEIAEQVRICQVRVIDGDGCLGFRVPDTFRASVEQRVPVEAVACDDTGNNIHMQLHIVNGQLDELEFYTESGAAVTSLPPAEKWEVIALPPPPL